MPNFRERIAGVFAAASSTGVALRVTGDTQDRIVIDAGGRISWGSGSAAADATLERSSTNVVRITNGLVVDTAGGSAPSRTVVLKNSGQNSVAFGAFPWEWSTSLQLQSNDSSRWLWINAGSNDGAYNSRIRAGNTGLDIYVGGTSANNGTLGLTVTSAGSVGIGTASPAAKLQVVGNARIGQASNSSTSALLEITAGGSGFDSIIDLGYWDTFDAALWFLKRHGADGSFRIANVGTGSEVPVLTITNSNTVGVGTTAPGSNKMRVEGGYLSVNNAESGTGELRIGAVYSLPGIYADVASLALRINSGTNSTGIELATNGNNVRLSINNSGVVSIPGSLSVTGGVTANLTGNASTATTLATARNINGTSFNGSADITTANWGTSRTITLGNTGKAVNGSGNVSWTITEIGAEERQVIGVPRFNLGNPTVREVAMFDSQNNNKTEFHPIASYFIETSTNGTTWTALAGVTDTQKRQLVGGDTDASIVIPYGTPFFRIRMRAVSYTSLEALYVYWSASGHSSSVQIFRKHDNDASWTQHTNSTLSQGAWPGHIYLPFSSIWWNVSATQGVHDHEVYALFTPTWNATYSQNGIWLGRVQWWGGYPAGRRNLYATDENRNAAFPASVNITNNLTFGSGGRVDFPDELADKVHWWSNSYGTGIESASLTHWAGDRHRFRMGGTSTTSGTEMVSITSTGMKIGGGDPDRRLDVAGNAIVRGGLTVNGGNTLTFVRSDNTTTGMALSSGTVNNFLTVSNGGFILTAPNISFDTDGPLSIRSGNGATTKVAISSGGLVGIGVASPSFALDVAGDANVSGRGGFGYSINSSGGQVSITPTVSSRAGLLIFENSANNAYTGNHIEVRAGQATTGGNLMKLALNNGADTRFIVDNTGKVGIGTSTPASPLQVLGYEDNSGERGILALSRSTAPAKRLILGYQSTSDVSFIQSIEAGVAHRSLALNPNGGTVGIGIINPQAALHVQASGGVGRSVLVDNREVKFRGDGVAHMSIFGPDTDKSYLTIQNTSSNASPGTVGTDLFTITSGGFVGIGTVSPVVDLHLSRTGSAEIRISTFTSGNPSLVLNAEGSNGGSLRYQRSGSLLTLNNAGVDGLHVTTTGGVGVGTTLLGSAFNKMRVEGGYLSVNNAEANTGELRLGAVYSMPGIYADAGSLSLRINSGTSSTGIELATNGNNVRMLVDNGGNVGIGTTSPQARLHVSGGLVTTDNAQGFYSRNAANNNNFRLISLSSSDHTQIGPNAVVRLDNGAPSDALVVNSAGQVTVAGNLVVNGTTFTTNSTTVTVDDPIFTLGGDTAPTVDDNKDRGIEFRWHNGTVAKVGFFGFDDSSGKFTFIPDGTNAGEVFTGTKGALDATIDWADVTGKPSNLGLDSVYVNVSGDTMTGNLTVPNLIVDTSATSVGTRQITLKMSGQGQIAYAVYPWEWSTALMLQSNNNNRFLWLNAGADGGTHNARLRAGATGLDIYVGGTSGDNGTHGLTVASTGRVGIGITSPGYALDVNGNVNIPANGVYRFGSGDAEVAASGYSLVFRTYDGVSAMRDGMRILNSGNVGIGTSTPSQMLEVNNGTYGAIKVGYGSTLSATSQSASAVLVLGRNAIGSPSSDAMTVLNTNGGIGAQAIVMGNGHMAFHVQGGSVTAGATYSAEKVRITSDGNLGIGTASPGQRLDVVGNAAISGTLTVSTGITGSLTGNASTASTLAVSRNINGTAFNGSADITTANWGTARTLTVGNTGKSVNGGANVSWTISEIGAASKPELEAVLGDLMYVGTYDAKNLGPNTKPTPTWSGGNTVYRHGMYWVVSSPGYVSYFTPDGVSGETDLATREPANATNQEVRPGDWIICQNPSYDPQSPDATFSVGSAIFRFLSFSAENYVARAIADHAADTSDPHSAAGYLTNLTGDQRYAKLIHNHASDIEQALINHRAEVDPHTQYLTLVEGNAAYASLTHLHDDRYERLGAVAAHVALTDPHPQYLTPAEGDAAYAPVVHNHDLLYYTKAQVDSAIAAVPREVFSSDGAQSSRLFIGSVQPASPAVGDLWIETANISLQPPPAPATLTAVAPSSTTITISWAAWATSVSQSSVAVQRRNGSDWTTVTPDTIFTDSSSPFDTSFTDTGRLEKTEYFYRVRAVNSAGNGEWGYVSIRTPNGAPGAPTSLTTSGITATQITLSWSAPSPFDGSDDGDKYEVFLNGVSRGFASGANTSFVFGSGAVGSSNPPLTERTTYTVGVRAKDAGDFNTGLNKLFSTIATTTATTGNAAPPPPKSAAASGVTHNQATLNWAAGDPVVADGHPAGGISDFLRYRVYLNDVEITNTTNTSYTFTGLSPSTAYKLEVRAEDTLNSLSTDNAAGSFVNITTSANPDTTPPLAPTITSFQPVTAYGRMQVAITWPSAADTNFGEVVYYPGSGAAAITWTTSVTPGASITRNFYDQNAITEAAGQTPRVAVRARDSSGNWSSVTEATYTLIASPYVVAADSSNSWRNESGGRYNATGNFRPVQGYFSNAALNATGLWYYGTKIADQIYNSGRRTVTNVEVYMRRNTGGSGSNQHVSIALHNELTNPGSVYTAGPTLYFPSPQTTPLQVTTGTGLAWNGGFEWCAITVAEWRAALVNGTNKGVAIRDADGVPYVILDSVAENGDSGRLRFTHLG